METPRFLVVNGVTKPSFTVPTVSSLLQCSTTGAYTTTRTSTTLLLFWRRHLRRLHRSLILLGHRPNDHTRRIEGSLRLALDLAVAERKQTRSDAELAVTVIVGGRGGNDDDDVWVHLGFYVPVAFGTGGARLAVAGRGRGEMAEAKYCYWARACTNIGIPLREVAPSWTDHDLWEEAFVTSSLRLVQHVETIQVPSSCENLHLKTWKDVSWLVKQFEGAGVITALIQREVILRAGAEGYPLSDII